MPSRSLPQLKEGKKISFHSILVKGLFLTEKTPINIVVLGGGGEDHNYELKNTLPTPRYGQYLTHALNHNTKSVAAMNTCFVLVSQHGIASMVSLTITDPASSTKASAKHSFKRRTHVHGSRWPGNRKQFVRGEVGLIPLNANYFFLAKVAGARIRNLKTMPKKKMRSNEEAHLCTQHQGKNMILEAHLMAFLNFNVLETWIN